MAAVICLVLAIALSIYLGAKTKINTGIYALGCAFLMGMVFLGLSPSSVFKTYFPTSIIATIICPFLFFGAVNSNGTIGMLAAMVGRKMKSANRAVAPLIIFAVTFALTFATAGGEGITIPMTVFGIGICLNLGLNPALGLIAVWSGWSATYQMPWTTLGLINGGIAAGSYGEEVATSAIWISWVLGVVFYILFILVVSLLLGRKKYDMESSMAAQISADEKIEFTRQQKLTIAVIAAIMAVIILPAIVQAVFPNPVTAFLHGKIDITICCLAGAIILFLTNCAQVDDVIKNRIPWGLILLLIGVCTLFGLIGDLGVSELLAEAIGNMPSFLVVPAISFICSFLSLFVNGATLSPMLIPLAESLAATAGIPTAAMVGIMLTAIGVSGISPTSGGGSTCLGAVSDAKLSPIISGTMAKLAIINMIGFAVFSVFIQFVF